MTNAVATVTVVSKIQEENLLDSHHPFHGVRDQSRIGNLLFLVTPQSFENFNQVRLLLVHNKALYTATFPPGLALLSIDKFVGVLQPSLVHYIALNAGTVGVGLAPKLVATIMMHPTHLLVVRLCNESLNEVLEFGHLESIPISKVGVHDVKAGDPDCPEPWCCQIKAQLTETSMALVEVHQSSFCGHLIIRIDCCFVSLLLLLLLEDSTPVHCHPLDNF